MLNVQQRWQLLMLNLFSFQVGAANTDDCNLAFALMVQIVAILACCGMAQQSKAASFGCQTMPDVAATFGSANRAMAPRSKCKGRVHADAGG